MKYSSCVHQVQFQQLW